MDELTLTSCSQGFFQLLLSRSFNILSVDLHVIVPEVVGSILQSVQSDRMSLYLCVWRNQTLTIRYWYRFDQNIIRPNTKDRLFVKTVCELHQPTRVSLNNIVLVKRSPWNSDQSTSWINHCINKLCWHNFKKKHFSVHSVRACTSVCEQWQRRTRRTKV